VRVSKINTIVDENCDCSINTKLSILSSLVAMVVVAAAAYAAKVILGPYGL